MFSISLDEILLTLLVAVLVLKPSDINKIFVWFRTLHQHVAAFKYQIHKFLDDINNKPNS